MRVRKRFRLPIFAGHRTIEMLGFRLRQKFDQFQTMRNKCQHCCGSMQTDATCWAQQCCVLLAKNVAAVCVDFDGFSRH